VIFSLKLTILWGQFEKHHHRVMGSRRGDRPDETGGASHLKGRRRRPGVTVPRQDVEDDVGGMDAVREGFGAGRRSNSLSYGLFGPHPRVA
jgi:hypothetical protein